MEFKEGEEVRPCKTQFGLNPIVRRPPSSKNNSDSDYEGDGILIRDVKLIPRCDASEPLTLHYYTLTNTFPDYQTAQLAESTFRAAANEWNNLSSRISIRSISTKDDANFYLWFVTNEPDDTTFASAFFPYDFQEDVTVYSHSLRSDKIGELKSTVLHEIDHILGLRHEFTISGDSRREVEPESDARAVRFMQKNYYFVMSYNKGVTLQQTDIEGTTKLYKLPNGCEIRGIAVVDYLPDEWIE